MIAALLIFLVAFFLLREWGSAKDVANGAPVFSCGGVLFAFVATGALVITAIVMLGMMAGVSP